MCAKSLQSCQTFCDPVDCSLPGSSVHGTLRTRTLEWAAMPFSRGSSRPRDRTHSPAASALAGGFFTTEPPGKPASPRYSQSTEKRWTEPCFPKVLDGENHQRHVVILHAGNAHSGQGWNQQSVSKRIHSGIITTRNMR